jgi:hypothetical protein
LGSPLCADVHEVAFQLSHGAQKGKRFAGFVAIDGGESEAYVNQNVIVHLGLRDVGEIDFFGYAAEVHPPSSEERIFIEYFGDSAWDRETHGYCWRGIALVGPNRRQTELIATKLPRVKHTMRLSAATFAMARNYGGGALSAKAQGIQLPLVSNDTGIAARGLAARFVAMVVVASDETALRHALYNLQPEQPASLLSRVRGLLCKHVASPLLCGPEFRTLRLLTAGGHWTTNRYQGVKELLLRFRRW